MTFLKVIIAICVFSIIDARILVNDNLLCGEWSGLITLSTREQTEELKNLHYNQYKNDADYALICYNLVENRFQLARYYSNYAENCTVDPDEFANETLNIKMLLKCDEVLKLADNMVWSKNRAVSQTQDLIESSLESVNISEALAQGNLKELNKFVEDKAKNQSSPIKIIDGVVRGYPDDSNTADFDYLYKIVTLSPNNVTAYIAVNGVEDKKPICKKVIPDCGWLDASKGKIYCCELDDNLLDTLKVNSAFL